MKKSLLHLLLLLVMTSSAILEGSSRRSPRRNSPSHGSSSLKRKIEEAQKATILAHNKLAEVLEELGGGLVSDAAVRVEAELEAEAEEWGIAQENGRRSFPLKESLKAGARSKVARGEQLTGNQIGVWNHLQRNPQIK